jgi:hypothetical protein
MKTKRCSECGEIKTVSEFYKFSKAKDGLRSQCKECTDKRSKEYIHTKDGLITRIYGNQRGNSKQRGDDMPTYSKQKLKEWLFSQKKFHDLYDNWKASNYDRMLAPSCDRLDDYLPYNLDNLQLTTWQENYDKGNLDRKNGKNNKHNKTVLQFSMSGEFMAEYHSSMEAVRQTHVNRSNMNACCRGERKSTGGFIWKYKDER